MKDDLSAHRTYLPPATAHAWTLVAPLVPAGGYLAGGTALTLHLHHRVSRDLDFFVAEPFDPAELRLKLERAGTFATTLQSAGTLHGVFNDTKVQFLDAHTQQQLADTTRVAGIEIASIRDLLATKLKVIADRGELRDYFDIMTILNKTPYTLTEGIGFYVQRYQPDPPQNTVLPILRGLASFDDVLEDPGLPVDKATIQSYWTDPDGPLAAVVRSLDTHRSW